MNITAIAICLTICLTVIALYVISSITGAVKAKNAAKAAKKKGELSFIGGVLRDDGTDNDKLS